MNSAAWRLCSRGLCLVLCLLALGCFERRYEERMEEAQVIFKHWELRNQNLRGEWAGVGAGIRPPLQFNEIAPPAPEEPPAEGEAPRPRRRVVDHRQPDFLRTPLPGLIGAWEAELAVGTADGVAPGHMYILTNHMYFRMADDEVERQKAEAAGIKIVKPQDFHQEVLEILSNATGQAIPAGGEWTEDKFPPSNKYYPAVFVNSAVTDKVAIGGVDMRFTLFMYKQDDVAAVVLFVWPEDVAASEKFKERMELCMETLKVDDRPASGATTVGPTGTPGTGF